MKINITIDPVILQGVEISLTWHGVCLAVGIIVVYFTFLKVGELRGFSHAKLIEFAFWVVLSGLVFARLLGILENWRLYVAMPTKVFALQDGGITVTGGVLGAVGAAFIYARRQNLHPGVMADALALAVPLGYILGRCGCLILGDTWGLPTNGNWGLVYWHENSAVPTNLIGVPTFPAPLMFQIANLILGISFLILLQKKRLPGMLLSIYLLGYGSVRFLVAYWQPGSIILWNLRYYQLIALILMALGLLSFIYFKHIQQAEKSYDW